MTIRHIQVMRQPVAITVLLAALLILVSLARADEDDFAAGKAAFDAEDYETAFEIWKPLADAVNAIVLNNLGVVYLRSNRYFSRHTVCSSAHIF